METPEPLWAIYGSAWSPSQQKSVSSCSGGPFLYLTLWPLALVLSLGATEEKLPPLSFSAFQVLIRTPWALSSLGWQSQLFQPVLTQEMLQVPSSPLWPFPGLCPVCLWVFCTGEPGTGHGTPPGVALPGLNRREGPPPLTWQHCIKSCPEYPGTSVPCLAHTGVLMPWVKCGCVRLSSESAWNDTWLKFLVLFYSDQIRWQHNLLQFCLM